MPLTCCVPQCSANAQKCKGLSFFAFPKNKSLKKHWLIAIRSGKNPSKYSRVCSRHFDEKDVIASSENSKFVAHHRKLKPGSIPTKYLPKRKFDRPVKQRKTVQRILPTTSLESETSSENPSMLSDVEIMLPGSFSEIQEEIVEKDETKNVSTASVSTQTLVSKQYNILHLQGLNDKYLKYYTGFNRNQFNSIISMLDLYIKKNPVHICSSVDFQNQIFMTLYIYRHAAEVTHIEFVMKVNRNRIKLMHTQWTNVLYDILQRLNFWEEGCKNKNEEQYTVILDCTEIETQKPASPKLSQDMWSDYKQRYTVKYLIGISESGIVMFCSDLYGGSISDREIIKKSGIIDLLKEGDAILADKGFLISDLVESKKVTVNIPPFKRGKQLKEKDVLLTRAFANRRILVERIIGYIKFHKTAHDSVNLYKLPFISQMVFNLCMLTNLKRQI